MKEYLLALDQGTTSSRAILFDRSLRMVSVAQRELTQHYPREGWVEHDPLEIFDAQYAVMLECVRRSGIDPAGIAAVGITNQRETAIVWDRHSGEPVYPAIVWQCRRAGDFCEMLKARGLEETIRSKTGLVLDAYFSGAKVRWILENVPGAKERAERGDLLFGTVDTWLLWKLTGGAAHVSDRTNACRTMLYNIHTLSWDAELLEIFGIPACMLPEVRSSSEVYATISPWGMETPVSGIAGDQQAALFGQGCHEQGMAKNTYGTGCFLLMNTGGMPRTSRTGLLTSLAATAGGEIQYVLEGSVFTGGAVIQWLRDELRMLDSSAQSEAYAMEVDDTGGVYIVPAFTGLGAPWWDMYARGCIVGLTRGTNVRHIVRASLESIAYQTCDLVDAMERDTGMRMETLWADGGASQNGFLMQFQADMLGRPVCCPAAAESTALGAACLAGLAVGFFENAQAMQEAFCAETIYTPSVDGDDRDRKMAAWHHAVRHSLGWAAEVENT